MFRHSCSRVSPIEDSQAFVRRHCRILPITRETTRGAGRVAPFVRCCTRPQFGGVSNPATDSTLLGRLAEIRQSLCCSVLSTVYVYVQIQNLSQFHGAGTTTG
jgi:hypothetical protein